MVAVDRCVVSAVDAAGGRNVRLGVGLLDDYLEFVAGRCRPNTVLATAFDLKVFFSVVAKTPDAVSTADVLGFITAQRTGGDGRLASVDVGGGVSSRTVRRRLSSVSGLFAYLHARGDIAANPVPRGLPTRRERQRPSQGVPHHPHNAASRALGSCGVRVVIWPGRHETVSVSSWSRLPAYR